MGGEHAELAEGTEHVTRRPSAAAWRGGARPMRQVAEASKQL